MIEFYEHEKHYPLVSSWWEAWGMEVVPPEYLPQVGVVVDGVVACFLFQTDSKIAYMEHLISDPKSEKKARKDAIEAAGDALMTAAKELGFTRVGALSAEAAVLVIGERRAAKMEPRTFTFLSWSV